MLDTPAAQPDAISHHLPDEVLLDYAAGSISEPMALIVATHLTYCPQCRASERRLEAVGGALVDRGDAVAMSDGALDSLLARLDLAPAPVRATGPALAETGVPRPLLAYLPAKLDDLPWHKVMSGLYEYRIPVTGHSGMSSLLRITPGRSMPRHTHTGNEATVVLRGGFEDATGHFLAGDVALTDDTVDHEPTADGGQDCICYAVTDAPLRLTGPFGRLLNPFLKI